MANDKKRLAVNIPGSFFVDSTCINCSSCWLLDPKHFTSNGEHSYVQRQPETKGEIQKALLALEDCPVGAIGAPKKLALTKKQEFPILVANHSSGNVYYCGWSSKKSFGASCWLIIKPGVNVLIDSPRWNFKLARRIKKMGGVKKMVLTHKDDVADHSHWAKEFNCERIINKKDGASAAEAERKIEKEQLVSIGNNLILISTPGHTPGSMIAVLGQSKQIVFSGDHLWWNREKELIIASKKYCWWNWSEQIKSMEKLIDLDVSWLLPGHGAAHHFEPGEWKHSLNKAINNAKKLINKL